MIIIEKGFDNAAPSRRLQYDDYSNRKYGTFSLVCLSTASITTPYDPWPKVRIFWYRGWPDKGSSPVGLLRNIALNLSLVAIPHKTSCFTPSYFGCYLLHLNGLQPPERFRRLSMSNREGITCPLASSA